MDSAADPLNDPEALTRLRRFGGRPLVDQMVALFLEHGPVRITAARAALANGDLVTVQRLAHMLKSSGAQLGAGEVQRLGTRVEDLAERGDGSTLGALLDEMERAVERWRAWLSTLELDPPAA